MKVDGNTDAGRCNVSVALKMYSTSEVKIAIHSSSDDYLPVTEAYNIISRGVTLTRPSSPPFTELKPYRDIYQNPT